LLYVYFVTALETIIITITTSVIVITITAGVQPLGDVINVSNIYKTN